MKISNWDELGTAIATAVAEREVHFISDVVERGAMDVETARQVVEDWRPEVLEAIGEALREVIDDVTPNDGDQNDED